MENEEIRNELEKALSTIRDIFTDNEYIDNRLGEIEEEITDLINVLWKNHYMK